MNRREALRLLATGAALQLTPLRLLALREARAAVAGQNAQHTLSSRDREMVSAIADLIIPRTTTPGASDVGVTDFIDLMLSEWYDDASRALFLSGLTDVDNRANALFAKNFLACSAVQQASILTALGEEMLVDANKLLHQPRGDQGEPQPPEKNFYYMLRRLTLTGYYTSEAGATDELGFEIIPGRFEGCGEPHSGKETAAAK